MKDRIIYLNNAATTWPKPREVIDEVTQSFTLPYYEEGRTTFEGQIDYPTATRQALSDFFRAGNADHMVFTQNATDALNIVIHGFTKHAAKAFHVITTELEHNAVLRPLATLEREGKITLSIAPSTDGYVSLDTIKNILRDDTRLIVMTHGSNVLGTVQDVRAIGTYLKTRDIFYIVDGAQTAGHIPIALSSLPVDVFVFTGHKALFSLPGIGGFYIKRPELVDTTKQGGTGVDSMNLFHNEEMPFKFEAGTHNYPGIASLYAGVKYLQRNDLSLLERSAMDMTHFLIKNLQKEENIVIYNANPDLPIISFSMTGLSNEDVGFILARMHSIICRTGLHCAPLVHERITGGRGCVRLSLSCLNTMAECRIVADAVREVARSARR